MKNIIRVTKPGLFNSDTLYYADTFRNYGYITLALLNKETGETERVFLSPADYEVVDTREL